jgi:Ca-activated chloride channel homolog
MYFAHPKWLWLLALVPLLAAWVVIGARRRARDWSALGQGVRLLGDGAAWWLGAIACLIVALGQPRWGRAPGPPTPPGHDVVLLVDVSRSMAVEDAVPSRLGAAIEMAEGLVRALGREPGNRMAVVAFAGRGVVRRHLTENLGAVADALRALRPGGVRPGGTDLGAALDATVEAFGDQVHAEGRAIVLLSDGEDHAGTWTSRLDRLREARVPVHAVAVGDDARGHEVPSGRGPAVLTYHGTPVRSKRSDVALEALARATGGAFVRAGLAPVDLGELYLTRIAPVARQSRDAIRAPERAERFGVFVLAALVLGVGGSWPRRGARWRSRGWVVVLALAGLGTAKGGESPADAVERGRAAYDAGCLSEALAAFERAIALDPAAAVPRFDAAATLFRLERYDEALARYGEARDRAGVALRTRIDYALGNTALALGDVAAAIRHYDACLASTAPGEPLAAIRRDAAINRRFAEEAARRPSSRPRPDEGSSLPPDRPKEPSLTNGKPPLGPLSEAPPPDVGSQATATTGRRGPGGARGTGPAPPKAGSPEGRLATALENIREAKHHRIEDESPPDREKDRMDW